MPGKVIHVSEPSRLLVDEVIVPDDRLAFLRSYVKLRPPAVVVQVDVAAVAKRLQGKKNGSNK